MEKIKILVVDDESRMRKLVRDFLVREGYVVLEAGDGMEAMDIFYEDKDIALVILDVMMPKMDGWQVCREIREHSKVPVIMLTARSDERDELQGFELGVGWDARILPLRTPKASWSPWATAYGCIRPPAARGGWAFFPENRRSCWPVSPLPTTGPIR